MTLSTRLLYQSLVAVIVIALSFFASDLMESTRYLVLALVILLVGMPHGALDHIIDEKLENWNGSRNKEIWFYVWYLALVGIYSVLWIFFPLFSFAFFMIITWYHFGQADAERFNLESWKKGVIHFSRGLTVVGLIAYGDLTYASSVIEAVTDFSFENFSNQFISPTVAAYSIAAFYPLCFLLISFTQKYSFTEFIAFFTDSIIVSALFLYSDPIWAFSIYFGLWHSYNHVRVMLAYLNEKGNNYNFGWFFKKSFIYSLLSYLGILFLYNMANAFGQEEYLVSLLFVVISVLTLPHMYVVERLYNKFSW